MTSSSALRGSFTHRILKAFVVAVQPAALGCRFESTGDSCSLHPFRSQSMRHLMPMLKMIGIKQNYENENV